MSFRFIGEGIPLIKPQQRSIPLKLLATNKFPDGVVHLHYRVLKQRRLPKVAAELSSVVTSYSQ